MDPSINYGVTNEDWASFVLWNASRHRQPAPAAFETPLPANNNTHLPLADLGYRPFRTDTIPPVEAAPPPPPASSDDENKASLPDVEEAFPPDDPPEAEDDALQAATERISELDDVQRLKRAYNELLEALGPWTQTVNRVIANFVEEHCLQLGDKDKASMRLWDEHVERMN
ncbi:MAG: hypothetical protein M1823_004249 [Watsoniomyces obsoletus]|nr:MAG: hypothetical protein M1823_004249 [Watsoniomyces obsoletus]